MKGASACRSGGATSRNTAVTVTVSVDATFRALLCVSMAPNSEAAAGFGLNLLNVMLSFLPLDVEMVSDSCSDRKSVAGVLAQEGTRSEVSGAESGAKLPVEVPAGRP